MGEQISIAALSTLVGMGIGIFGFVRTNKKDIKDDTTQSVKLEAKIDNISWGVDAIRLDIKDQGRKIDVINERLTRCEESTKSGHKRLDQHIQLHEENYKEMILMLNEILYLNPSRQPNNIGVNGYGTEADNMMIVAKRVKGKLDMSGIIKKIVLTEGLTLSQAIAESNAVGATLHLEMHSDADGDDNSKTGFGCTGIYKSDKGKQFISCIYKHVSALTPTYDRGLSYRTDLGASEPDESSCSIDRMLLPRQRFRRRIL